MYTPTQAQLETEKRFLKKGYKFVCWIPSGDPFPNGVMVMEKRINNHRTVYVEIEPDGAVN